MKNNPFNINLFTGVKNMEETKLTETIEKYLGFRGRMIAGSKALYCRAHPNNEVYFNACIYSKNAQQVWWGDVDLTRDSMKLKNIAKKTKAYFYVTPEHPFRSDFNKVTKKQLDADTSVLKVEPKGRNKYGKAT